MVALTRRNVTTLFVAAGLLLGVRTVALAHAMLVSAEPAAGSQLASSPARVRLVFSEALEVSLAELSLTGDDGRTVRLAASGDPHDVHALIAPVGPLAAGSYRITWRVVSADGHPVDGAYVFTVGAAVVAPPPITRDDIPGAGTAAWGPMIAGAPIVPAIARGLAIGALMSLAGLLLFASWPGATDEGGATGKALRALALATVVLLVLNIGAWTMNAVPDHRLTGDTLAAALGTSVGRVELWRAALALLAAWALWLARRTRLALAFALAAVVVSAASGHSAAIHSLWNVPTKAVHLLATSAWLGGLLWLLTRRNDHGAAFVRAAARVSAVALVAVIVVTLSGVVQTLLILPSPLDLFRSAYGTVILAKVAGLLALVAFGARHRIRMMPRLAQDSTMPSKLRASVAREVGVMAVVVLLAGLLAFIPPPGGAPIAPSTSSHES